MPEKRKQRQFITLTFNDDEKEKFEKHMSRNGFKQSATFTKWILLRYFREQDERLGYETHS